MTRDEAITTLKEMHDSFDEIHENTNGEIGYEEMTATEMAIEALTRPKGEWKTTFTGQPYCSNCEYVFGEDEEFSPFWNYCPMCGTRMENKE